MSQPGIVLEPTRVAHAVPATMRAAVYRGKGKVVVETVPVPVIGAGRSIDPCGYLREFAERT